MKALITGGTSSLGLVLKPILLEFCEVITAGRKNCDISIDLNDSLQKIIFPEGINVIVHTAANYGGDDDKQILDAETVNVLGTLKLCQAAVQAKVKHFIFISSIYSGLEESAQNYSIYALSKKHAEEIAHFYCALHALPLTILRPVPIYGTGDGFAKHQPFFYTIIDKVQKGEDIILFGSNDALRNFIHVEDMAEIIAKVIQQKIEGTYACVHPENSTWSQIAKAAISAFNSKALIHFLKDKPDIPDNIFQQDDSLYQKIGFQPQITIEDGMKKIMAFKTQDK